MPSFLAKFRRSPSRPSRQPAPRSLPDAVPDEPCRRLDFWVIQDRSEVLERIVPYVTGKLPEDQRLWSLVKEKPWLVELIHDEHEDAEDDAAAFPKTEAAFWSDTDAMVEELRHATRAWFRMLLRYTIRAKHRAAWKTPSPAVSLESLASDDFASQLDEKEMARLIRRANLSADYKNAFNETKQRPAWTHFCARMKTLTSNFGLQTASTKLEPILLDLEKDVGRLKSARIHRLNDSLMSCRQLMENLLPEQAPLKGNFRPRGNEYGKRWRELFMEQWRRCKQGKLAGHPLQVLVSDDKYYNIGVQLYGTLSERLHNHQENRDKELDADVLSVVFAILPPVFSMPAVQEGDRRWDIDVEKQRWDLVA